MVTQKWPESAGLDPGQIEAIEKAVRERPIPGNWPDDQKFVLHPQGEAIGRVLIEAHHEELVNARIAYLLREKSNSRGRQGLGKTYLLAGKREGFLSGFDFALVFNWEAWTPATVPTRTALVDHELSHCGLDDEGRYILLPHDVEEFGSIVRRWGAWHRDVGAFLAAAKGQLEMFGSESAGS